jgi:hypothetical protein
LSVNTHLEPFYFLILYGCKVYIASELAILLGRFSLAGSTLDTQVSVHIGRAAYNELFSGGIRKTCAQYLVEMASIIRPLHTVGIFKFNCIRLTWRETAVFIDHGISAD